MLIEQVVEFFKMGEYGSYVWLSFAAFLIIFWGLWLFPARQLKKDRQSQ